MTNHNNPNWSQIIYTNGRPTSLPWRSWRSSIHGGTFRWHFSNGWNTLAAQDIFKGLRYHHHEDTLIIIHNLILQIIHTDKKVNICSVDMQYTKACSTDATDLRLLAHLCHGLKGGHHLLSVSNCNPALEASWATMVTRRSRCLWTPSKAKSTSKRCKLTACALTMRVLPDFNLDTYIPNFNQYIHAITSVQGHDTTQYYVWIWSDLFQNNDHKKPASQPKQTIKQNKPTKQLQPRDDLQAHFPGFFRFGCLLPRMVEDGLFRGLFTYLLFSPKSAKKAWLHLVTHLVTFNQT